MSVSNILNKTNLSELSEFLNEMEAKPIPLKNNVIYFQADDTYICVKGKKKKLKQLKTGRWVKARNWKVFRVVTVHTGYNIIAKLGLANKRVFTFEIKDWSWTKTLEICKKFYQINDETQIYVCGDGASWIKNGAEEINAKFVMDTFHVIREYSRILNHKNNIEHENILKTARNHYSKGEFTHLHQLTVDLNNKIELQHKKKKINKLINYLNSNQAGIEIYADRNVMGVSVEGDIFNYVKRFLGKRKTFNEKAIATILTIQTAIKNKINILKYLKHEMKEQNLANIQETINLKWKYQAVTDPPILKGEFAGDKNRYFYKAYLKMS